MKHYTTTPKTMALFVFLIFASLAGTATNARAYDMDCKVILCIAGGFPSGCNDAWRYMIKRITNKPKPKPPFGFCAMSDGSEYKAHNVDYQFLSKSPSAYDCPTGKQLFFGRREEDRGSSDPAFCYTSSSQIWTGGRDGGYQTVYHGRTFATPVNFQLQIIIEPGTQHEFRSPLFRVNTSTGYVSQQPL